MLREVPAGKPTPKPSPKAEVRPSPSADTKPMPVVVARAAPAPTPAPLPKTVPVVAPEPTTGEIDVDDILTEANRKLEVKTPHSKRQPAKTEPLKVPPALGAAGPQPAHGPPPVPRSLPPTVPTRATAAAAREELDDERIAGLPRKVSPQAKRIVVIVVALAVILSVVGGLQALRYPAMLRASFRQAPLPA